MVQCRGVRLNNGERRLVVNTWTMHERQSGVVSYDTTGNCGVNSQTCTAYNGSPQAHQIRSKADIKNRNLPSFAEDECGMYARTILLYQAPYQGYKNNQHFFFSFLFFIIFLLSSLTQKRERKGRYGGKSKMCATIITWLYRGW